jgi:predicted glycosyltransferase
MMSNDGLEELTASDIGTDTAEKQQSPSGMNLSRKKRAVGSEARRKVWIDLENSPHVPFFRPIMRELEKLNYEIVLTARDCFQVCELADMEGLSYRKIGRHYGKNRLAKLAGLGIRVLQLAPLILRKRPAISVSHGSRSLIVLSALLGIRSVTIADYEHADLRLIKWLGSARDKWIMTPEVIPSDIFTKNGMPADHVLHYPGIKEDVYVPSFRPDPALRHVYGFSATDVIVVIRPPATEAHYHNPESEKLLMAVFDMLEAHPDARVILLPRTHKQETELREARPEMFATRKIVVPEHAVNGLDLIWYSDLVISGGGTMNREAAALGIPVYSLFRGTPGAVDRYLAQVGKLVLLESVQDVRERLKLVPREKASTFRPGSGAALQAIVKHIHAVIESRTKSHAS